MAVTSKTKVESLLFYEDHSYKVSVIWRVAAICSLKLESESSPKLSSKMSSYKVPQVPSSECSSKVASELP